MNSLKRIITAAGAAVIISSITAVFPFIVRSEENHPLPFSHTYEDLTPAQEKDRARTAKQTAISAATGLLKQTRAWKGVAKIQKQISERYSFEFRKSFSKAGSNEKIRKTGTDDKIKKSGELVFSGGIGPDMTPSLSLVSGFRPADVAVRFDVLDRELDCEISSRPVNRFMGSRTSLGLSTDGETSHAIIKISFEF